jgi:hypothetical protein
MNEAKSFPISSGITNFAEDVQITKVAGVYEYAVSGWFKLEGDSWLFKMRSALEKKQLGYRTLYAGAFGSKVLF